MSRHEVRDPEVAVVQGTALALGGATRVPATRERLQHRFPASYDAPLVGTRGHRRRARRPVRVVATILSLTTVAAACSGTTSVETEASGPTSPTTSLPTATVAATTTSAPPPPVPQGDPRTMLGSGQPVTITFGGDIHFDGPLASTLAKDPASMLLGVQPVFGASDLAVVNLETSIGTGGTKASKKFTFQAPPAALGAVTAGGVDVIGMANNHAMDFGQKGLTQTFDAITEQQADVIGLGRDETAAYAPYRAEINGQRIAVIAATQVIDSNLLTAWTATTTNPGVASAKRVDRLVAAVRQARAAADTVVVFLHWGTEKTFCPDKNQLALAPLLAEAGADVIVGTHAHRVQGGGFLGPAYVEYGLGNLQFKVGSDSAREGGLLQVTVTGRRVDDAKWIPIVIGPDFLPTVRSGAAATAATDRWESRRGCAQLAPTYGAPVATGSPDLGG